MKKLLQLEYIKYSRSNIFYIFIGLFIAIVVLSEITTAHLGSGAGMKFGFPDAWTNLVYTASWMNFFIGIMVLISITSEYQSRTLRQHVVDGLDKKDIFVAKYLYAIGIALFAVIFVAISVVCISYAYATPVADKNMFNGMELLGKYFVQLMGYISMAVFFAFLLRNTSLGIIVYLFYMPIESLVSVGLFHSPTNARIADYFPKNLFSNIVPKPGIVKFVSNAAGLHTNGPTDQTILILGCVYIIIFIAGSYWLFNKRDL